MSTSSDFSWAGADAAICSFEYPAAPSRDAAGLPDEGVKRRAEWHQQLQQARLAGERDGELQARKVFEESLRATRQQIAVSLAEFESERKSYFRRVESEVVQLSMAIARRVLHREAQVDRSLIAGLVRSLIGELGESTGVALRVHSSQEHEWKTFFAQCDCTPAPQVIGDANVQPGNCVISTQLGTTEIGIESQLKEIEKGLFDLMAQRPGLEQQ